MDNNTDKTLFNLEVKELGIVRNAKINIKPFTIFFGKNNTGKTYLAYVIYGICSPYKRLIDVKLISPIDLKPISDFLRNFIENVDSKEEKNIKKYISVEKEIDAVYKYSISEKFINDVFNHDMKCGDIIFKLYNMPTKLAVNLYVDIVKNLDSSEEIIKKYFKNIGFDVSFTINIYSAEFNCHIGYTIDDGLITYVGVLLTEKAKDINFITATIKEIGIKHYIFWSIAEEYIKEKIAKNVIFIPASKSGIYLLRKPLFKRGAEETLGKKVKVKKEGDIGIALPEPIIDFVKATLIERPKINEDFKDLVEFGEKHIVHGSLEYNPEIDEVFYKPEKIKAEIPPQIASALVVESIPLLTFLKYGVINKESFVILEEPEAHLHPDAQRNLVRLLIRLVNRGARVLLITHSPYVLQQINNCIMLYKLDKVEREEFFEEHGYTEDDVLNPDLVSAYLFELDKKGYSRVKPLEIDLEGIQYDAFYATLMKLSKETRELRRLMHEPREGKKGYREVPQ